MIKHPLYCTGMLIRCDDQFFENFVEEVLLNYEVHNNLKAWSDEYFLVTYEHSLFCSSRFC